MGRLTTRLALAALLAVWLAGCGLPLRELPYAVTHQVATVPSESMAPTIKPGDHVAIKVGFYDEHPVQRFDIVAYKNRPENVDANGGREIFIARVIGLGGETVEFKGGQVFVNGRPLEEPFQTVPPGPPDPHRDPGRPWVQVPPGEYLLVGDNRANSYDGRYWGTPTLPKKYIHGKVVEIFPQHEAGTQAPAPRLSQ
ncbi:MAG TPA: signal peptidase I [Pyrinomonadaceae bacterium]|nr:signal peptidase I [Pyrinomonadaceae bacterium]